MTCAEIFKNNLRSLRKQKGWSQSQVATQLDIPKQRYINWERGIQPDIDSLSKIAALYNTPIDELVNKLSVNFESIKN